MSGISSPIKWHGGKHYLAKRIIELFPPHVHYVEPYFGGGSVLFAKPAEWIEGHSEVANDIYGELNTFWQALKCDTHFEEVRRILECTPLSELEFRRVKYCTSSSIVQRAVNFFIRYRQSRQGLGKDFATMSRSRTRRGMNEQVSSWLTAIEGLPEAHERLKRVVVSSKDAIKIILQEDSPDTFFYLDPPYLQETRVSRRAYAHEMTVTDHRRLLGVLSGIKGKFLLSGYPSELYDTHSRGYGWNRIDIEIDNKASSQKVKPKKTESLWMNYDMEGGKDVDGTTR